MKIFRNNLEKDFEFFVKNLTVLEPIEFCGLAKIFGVSMVHEEKLADFSKEEYGGLELEVMDKYLALPKRKRKEINQMLKDIKRGK